jgi:MFS family permease
MITELKTSRAVTIASIGGGLEIYDFTIYIFFAPILSTLFFPHANSFVALLDILAVFAVGYLARPLGAFLFGHYGDKLGRKKGLLFTIALMALATTFMGLIPSYNSIGIAAPILLVILRFLQGIAVGGDLPGAITFVAEYAADHKRGLACGLIYCGVNIGLLLASGVSTLLIFLLPHPQLVTWGWRLAFMLGLAIGVVGFYLRRKIADTPYFERLEAANEFARIPMLQVFRKNLKQFWQGSGLLCLFSMGIAQVFYYMPTYLHTVTHLPLATALTLNTISILIFSLFVPLAAYLSDKIGRKPVILLTAILFFVFSYPLYLLLNQPDLTSQLIALSCLAIITAGIIGTIPSALTEMFPTPVRYSGVSTTYNISFAIFGGLTPVIATYLIYKTQLAIAPCFNLMVGAVIAFIAALTMKEMSGKSLRFIEEQHFFGMHRAHSHSVTKLMEKLRSIRYKEKN